MKLKEIKTRIGIGDLIIYRSLFLEMIGKGQYDHINIYPDYSGLYWRSNQYKEFVERLNQLMFPESFFTVKLEDKNIPASGWTEVFSSVGSYQKIDLSSVLNLHTVMDSKNRICIFSKARGMKYSTYQQWIFH